MRPDSQPMVARSTAACLHTLVHEQAGRTPDSVAVVFEEQTLTYRHLCDRARVVARRLRSLGVGPDVPVGLCLERSPDLLVAILGILEAGGAYVPLDPTHPQPRLEFIARNAGCEVIVTERVMLSRLGGAGRVRVLMDDDVADGGEGQPEEPVAVGGAHLAYVMYTSGSTGQPKGVCVTHASVVNLLWSMSDTIGVAPGGTVLATSAYAFDISVAEFFLPLLNGGRVALLSDAAARDPDLIIRAIGDLRPAAVQATPTMWNALCSLGWPGDPALTCVSGGEPLPAPLAQSLSRQCRQLWNCYGPTETTIYSTAAAIDASDPVVTIGTPLANTLVYVVDQHDHLVPTGVTGELWIGGAGVARGYRGRPELTAERFVDNPFCPGDRVYRTGDLARWRADGRLEMLGRADTQVKIRGHRIELEEIEAQLSMHPSVLASAAAAIANQAGEVRLVAYIVTRGQLDVDARALQEHLRSQLPDYMIPGSFVRLLALPTTANGKIDRKALPAPDPGRAHASEAFVAPQTPEEHAVAGVFAEVLGVPRVSADANFFDMGGHSLLATQVAIRLRRLLRCDLPIREVFEHPTAVSLGAHLAARPAAQHPAAVDRWDPATRDAAPLSFAQERFWFLSQFEPESAAYNMEQLVRLRGALDIDALRAALQTVVDRHAVLRTTYVVVGDAPRQVVHPSVTIALPVVDLGTGPPADREARARQQAAENAGRVFDLARDVPVRARLFRLAPDEHLLQVVVHHIAGDGWSMGVLWSEVGAAYSARVTGIDAVLPALREQYADFATKERSQLRDDVLREHLAYWRTRLEGFTPPTLTPDFPRRVTSSRRGAAIVVPLPAALTARIRTLCGTQRVTPFMVLLAAFQILLSRLTGQGDVAVGLPVVTRQRPELEHLIGLFLNTLVIRSDVSSEARFTDVLERLRDDVVDALDHQDLPFEQVVSHLGAARNPAQSSLFQILFNIFEADGAEAPQLEGIDATPEASTYESAKFDLTLYGSASRLAANYDVSVFRPERIAHLLQQYVMLLEQVTTNPDRPITDYSLVTTSTRALLPDPQAELQAPAFMGSAPEAFLACARLHGAAEAISWAGRSWTYADLSQLATGVAGVLVRQGLAPGDVVALEGHPSAGLVASFMGVMLAGGVVLPLEPALPRARKQSMVRQAGAGRVITVGLRDHERWWRDAAPDVVELAIDPERADVDAAAPVPRPDLHADAPAYVFFTSGSTGEPKGIVGHHRGLAHFIQWQRETFHAGPGDRVAQLTPLSFDVVLRDIFLPLTSGATLCLPGESGAARSPGILEWCGRERITVLHVVPSVARQWLATTPTGLGPWSPRLVFSAGEPLTSSLVSRWREVCPGVRLVNLYGPTETCLVKAWYEVPLDTEDGIQPNGRALPATQLLVLGPSGQPCGIGEPGEVVIRTPCGTRGYLEATPAEERARFRPNPFRADPRDIAYWTGDVGRYRRDGSLEILGRKDQQVKVRGVRVEPREVEAVLETHPAVRAVSVSPRTDEDGETRLVAYIVAADVTVEALRSHLAGRLPASMLPERFVCLDRLPLTASGKVDRRALPEPSRERPALAAPFVAPSTATERTIAEVFAHLLGLSTVGIHDDFFALGGHSLLATRALVRLQSSIGPTLTLRAFFDAPTVAGLAAHVEKRTCPTAPEPTPTRDAEGADSAPASFAQQRLWLVDQFTSGQAPYVLPYAIRLQGRLDAEALTRAFDSLLERHAALRTTIDTVEGHPHQRVRQPPRGVLAVIDLRHLDAARREEEVSRLVSAEVARPFTLSTDLPFRALLLRVADDRHVLVLVLHHIATDGWSMGILWRELGVLYGAHRAGQPSMLPPLPVQYTDVARWERARLRGPTRERLLAFWRNVLANLPTLELATDRPRPAHVVHRGGRHELSLDAALAAQLEALARQERATLFHVLLAGFQILLARYTGQEDIAVGTPVANRLRPEHEGLIGFFANTLVLRATVADGDSFRQALGQVRNRSLDAFDHQELPFEQLVEDLRPERTVDRNPLVQVVFAFQNAPGAALALDGLEVTRVPLERPSARFDLELHLWRDERGGLGAQVAYSADLFDAVTIERLTTNFRALLTGIVASPDTPIGALPLVSASELQQLRDWTSTAAPLPAAGSVHRLFETQVQRTPRAVALRWRDEDLTYADLNRRANQLARRLRAHGVGRDVVVAVRLPRSIDLPVALLAILKAGGAYLPLDPSEPADRVRMMVEDAGARVLLTGGADGVAPPLDTPVIRLDVEAASMACEDDRDLDTAAGPDDLAYVMYTSGSTGRPKGVEILHRGIVRLVCAEVVPLGPDDAVLQLAPVSFDASTFEIWAPLLRGARCVLYPEPDVDLGVLERVLARERISRLWLTSSLFNVVIDHRPEALAGLEWLLVGGETLSVPHVSRALARHPSLRILNGYGPTEATTFTCVHPIERPLSPDAPPIPIGRPIANTTVYVLDRQRRLAPIGAAGELHVGGPGVARGYRHRDDLTRERFIEDPFSPNPGDVLYKTGDRVRYRSDGALEFLGRTDRQLKIRGFRIEPEEIERLLAQHPGVGSCAVVVREDTPGDRRLVAYVVPTDGASLDATALSPYAKARLPGYMVPAAFVVTPALPLTANGKLDRRALPVPDYAGGTPTPRVDRPLTDTEAALTTMWCDVLGLGSVGVRTSFFELGGHSLLAVRLFSRMEGHFGVRLPLARLLSHPTIEELASVLDDAASSPPWSPLVPIRAGGTRKPLFLVHGIGGEVLSFKPLALQLPADLPVFGIQGAAPGTDADLPTDIELLCARYVDSVLSVDPDGPYYVGGYSSGGVYALELAQQLLARGKQVERLFIIDGGLPSNGRPQARARHSPWSFARQLAYWLVDDGLNTSPRIWGKRIGSNVRRMRARVRRRLDPAAPAPDIRDQLGMWNFPDPYATYMAERYDAFRRYTPRPYPGRIVLLRSRTGRLFRPPTAAINQAWLDLAHGGLDVVDLPGSHTTVLHGTHVSDLARAIEERMG